MGLLPGGARAETALNFRVWRSYRRASPRPSERVWSKLRKAVAGVHPDREDVDTVLEEDPVLLPRSSGSHTFGPKIALFFREVTWPTSGWEIAATEALSSRTSSPSSQALASSVPSFATTLPSASRKLQYPTGSFSFELSPRSLRGRVVALAPESTTKSTRVHPEYLSVAPFEPVSVLPPKAEVAHRGPPFAFSAFSALRCFFAFLAAVTFVSDGGSSLVRAFGSGNSSCGSSSNSERKGHRKSACWYAKENGGTGKPKEPKAGAKGTKGKKGGKGKSGKGKGKPHSFEGEGEDEQEWPEGDGQDGEQAGDGDLGFLCVLGPSADSAPGTCVGRLHLLCQVRTKHGAPNYWCPCPGCKGQKKRFNEDALTQHLWSKRDEPGHPSTSQFEAATM